MVVAPYFFRGFVISERMIASLVAYVQTGRPVGDFLQAVIANDLRNAVNYADDENLQNLPAYIGYLVNKVPGTCWGSREAYKAWIDHAGLKGTDYADAWEK